MTKQALNALKAVDFDWSLSLSEIWTTPHYHLPDLHQREKSRLLEDMQQFFNLPIDKIKPPLGWVIVGEPGSGKTQLLSDLRQQAFNQKAFFISLDLLDVREFADTARQGYLDSLEREGFNGKRQLDNMVEHLFVQELHNSSYESLSLLNRLKPETLRKFIDRILVTLGNRYRLETKCYQDVIRASILCASEDFMISNIGYTWLQGIEIDSNDHTRFGLRNTVQKSIEIVRGLSWLMGLAAPTLLAADQLDTIVSELNKAVDIDPDGQYADIQRRSLSIIENIAGGLMSLRDNTTRTLVVLSCIDRNWETLAKYGIKSSTDRFKPPVTLKRLNSPALAREMISRRLNAAYSAHGFNPPYPSYPFKEIAFDQTTQYFPRDLLKRCHEHRNKCVSAERILELDSFAPIIVIKDHINLSVLDDDFKQLKDNAHIETLKTQDADDGVVAALLTEMCLRLSEELHLPEGVDTSVDRDFNIKAQYPPLHARFRLIYRQEGDRERHFCFRALYKTHPQAFGARLKAAMTLSGIDPDLPFRKLVILRYKPISGGPVTQALLKTFQEDGGIFHTFSDDELRTLLAVTQIAKAHPAHELSAWLKQRQPLCNLPLLQKIGLCELFNRVPETLPAPDGSKEDMGGNQGTNSDSKKLDEFDRTRIPLGRRLIGSQANTSVTIPLEILTRHTVILGSAGSGKTVLLRRMVEEAALRGIPAIVIDGANDLARLGQCWPTPPESWSKSDTVLANTYFQKTEAIIWTPGISQGNPMHFDPLPDLTVLADDSDSLQQAVSLAGATLREVVAPGVSGKAKLKQGVLADALYYSAYNNLKGLDAFIGLLTDLPIEVSKIGNAQKLAAEMATQLKAQCAQDVFWKQQGTPLDPGILLGKNTGNQTRISIINLHGLGGLANQQQFLAQLGMSLFTWIKQHPATPQQLLQGLLVIDEAKDFIPATANVVCKDALLRLAAQARKYGLGLIFASQAPKSIDHNAIANCTTQAYGKAGSPAAIDTVKELIRARHGSGQDIATLERGGFYIYSEGFTAPYKVLTPLCLSYHGATPTEADIRQWAAASKDAME